MSNPRNKYRDVLRDRLVSALLGPVSGVPHWVSIKRYEAVARQFHVRIENVKGTNIKIVRVEAKIRGVEVVFDKESTKTFPSEKLLAQLALVL